jgi:hypothetical protein
MKRQSILTIAMALGLFMSFVSFPLTAQAQQPPKRFRGDTGVITLGMGQVLRITIASEGFEDNILAVRFAWMKYMPAGCNNDGVCRHTIQSEGVTAPVNIPGHEAASFDVQGTGNGVRVEVRANTAHVIADESIINTASGEVTSHVIMANTEGDFH